jgi:hypothetical protein
MALCAALAIALGGCTPSRVDPNARIDIGGQLRRQDGSPVSHVTLALTKGPDILDVLATIGSAGLLCLTNQLPNACHHARLAKTGADGAFAYTLRGHDTQGNFGQASTLELDTHLPRKGTQLDGPAVTMRFQVQTQRLNLPLHAWEPSVSVTGNPNVATARWSALPPTILPPQVSLAGVHDAVQFSSRSQDVWTFGNVHSGMRFDPRYLEDTTGSMAVYAEEDGVGVGESFGTRIDMVWRSAQYPYVSPVGAPVSRDKGCFVYDAKKRPVAQANCALTDGNFDEQFSPHTAPPCTGNNNCAEPRHTTAVIDLGRARPVTLVVVRGCDDRCVVDLSNNAKTWRPAGSGAEFQANLGIVLPGIAARYVRIRGSNVGALHEVSVWDRDRGTPPVRVAGPSLLTDPKTAGQKPLGSKGGGFPWKIVIAAIAVLAIAGTAFGLGRVRSARA